MSKQRAYTFVRPCRDCKTDVRATFLITDKQALLVAKELDKPGAMLCKDCGAKAQEEAERDRLAKEGETATAILHRAKEMKEAENTPAVVVTARDTKDEPKAAKLETLIRKTRNMGMSTVRPIPPTTDHPLPLPDPAPAVPQAGSGSEM
jgi:hypothetical protein